MKSKVFFTMSILLAGVYFYSRQGSSDLSESFVKETEEKATISKSKNALKEFPNTKDLPDFQRRFIGLVNREVRSKCFEKGSVSKEYLSFLADRYSKEIKIRLISQKQEVCSSKIEIVFEDGNKFTETFPNTFQ